MPRQPRCTLMHGRIATARQPGERRGAARRLLVQQPEQIVFPNRLYMIEYQLVLNSEFGLRRLLKQGQAYFDKHALNARDDRSRFFAEDDFTWRQRARWVDAVERAPKMTDRRIGELQPMPSLIEQYSNCVPPVAQADPEGPPLGVPVPMSEANDCLPTWESAYKSEHVPVIAVLSKERLKVRCDHPSIIEVCAWCLVAWHELLPRSTTKPARLTASSAHPPAHQYARAYAPR